ncbi:hypothetical protein DRN85_10110 [Methanosarcinales archaeon]|nr:MAG: hypothetical protein DRN85_10110 [Methanosarcinales archaeon]
MSIIGGRKTNISVPVTCANSREKVSVDLNGTAWVTVKEFTHHTFLSEILAVVPALAGSTDIYLALFDEDYTTDGQERWNSGAVDENATTALYLDRIVVPGTLLKIKANSTGTETVNLVLYKLGI